MHKTTKRFLTFQLVQKWETGLKFINADIEKIMKPLKLKQCSFSLKEIEKHAFLHTMK